MTTATPALETTPAQRQQARLNTLRLFFFPAYTSAIHLALLISGAAVALRNVWGHGQTLTQQIAFIASYLLITSLAALPAEYFFGYKPDAQAGLLRLTPGQWLSKWVKGTFIGSVISGVLYLGVNAVFGFAPDTWWWSAMGLITVFMAALTLLQPWLSRRMADIQPLENPHIEGLASEIFRASGVKLQRISVAHVAAESRSSNAFVQPAAGGAELMVTDTLLEGIEDEELRFIIAHEVGHYAKRDLWKLQAWQWLMLLLMVAAAALALQVFGTSLGLQGSGDIATVPLLAVTFTVIQRTLKLLGNALKRHMEYRADAFALRITHNLPAMQRVFQKLSENNALDPNVSPLNELLHDHPSLSRRIAAGAKFLQTQQGAAQ